MSLNSNMKIVVLDTQKIIPYARNPRKNADAVTKVRASLQEFGWQQPIVVDKEMVVIVGHTRLEAAKELGYTEVPVFIADHLTDAQVKAYRIADNRVHQEAEWDIDLLKLEFADLQDVDFDLAKTGFDDDELNNLLAEAIEKGFTDEDSVPEIPVKPITKLGDIYKLGNHRLMCGDSTSIDAVEKLMDGDKADMVFTDPPYNINYQDMTGSFDKIKNDKMSDEDFLDFLVQTIMPCETMYVCCSWQYAHIFKQAMTNLGYPPKAMIVWNKVNPAQNLDKYFKQHEIIWYYGEFGGQKTLRGDIWEIKRQRNTVHPTMKPVELIDLAMQDQPNKRIIYDAFGGSGSTLISAEKNGRKARLMELDPKYCDVIVKRWEDFTGKKAELINGNSDISA